MLNTQNTPLRYLDGTAENIKSVYSCTPNANSDIPPTQLDIPLIGLPLTKKTTSLMHAHLPSFLAVVVTSSQTNHGSLGSQHYAHTSGWCDTNIPPLPSRTLSAAGFSVLSHCVCQPVAMLLLSRCVLFVVLHCRDMAIIQHQLTCWLIIIP